MGPLCRPAPSIRPNSLGPRDEPIASADILRFIPRGAPQVGPVAQWLEPAAHNGLVAGSSPARPTKVSLGIASFLAFSRKLYATLYATTTIPIKKIAMPGARPDCDARSGLINTNENKDLTRFRRRAHMSRRLPRQEQSP